MELGRLIKVPHIRRSRSFLPRPFGNNVPGHTTRAPPVGCELATNGIQFYAIANLDKTNPGITMLLHKNLRNSQ